MKYLIALIAALALSGCTTHINPEVDVIEYKGQMNILGDQYRSAGSADAVLGSFGRKLTSGLNRYQLDGNFVDDFEVREPQLVHVSFEDISEINKLGFKLSQEAKANINYDNTKKGSYKLLIIKPKDPSLFDKAIREKYSSTAVLQTKIQIQDPDFRYISSLVYVMDFASIETGTAAIVANANLDRIVNGFNLDIDLKNGKSDTITLPDSQVIAYQYRRLCWAQGEIVDTVRDQIGTDSGACSNGSDHEYPGPNI